MAELLVDFITSLDGCGSAEGWPGWWGLEGPEYLAWLEAEPERTLLMGATTYRVMSGMAAGATAPDQDGARAEEAASVDEFTRETKVVFSSTLDEPLSWANTELVTGDAVEAVRAMKRDTDRPMSTLGSISLCRSLLAAGLVDRFRVVVFPVITGATGLEPIYDGYPDVALEMTDARTFDGRIQLVEYIPCVLDGPPGTDPARIRERDPVLIIAGHLTVDPDRRDEARGGERTGGGHRRHRRRRRHVGRRRSAVAVRRALGHPVARRSDGTGAR